MRGYYSARGQIDTGPVREALAGPAWALHSIVGWVEAENQLHLTSVVNGMTQNQQDSTNVIVGTSLLNDGYLKARNGMT